MNLLSYIIEKRVEVAALFLGCVAGGIALRETDPHIEIEAPRLPGELNLTFSAVTTSGNILLLNPDSNLLRIW